MTTEEFETFWTSTYPGAILISHYLKHYYPERWFRIHSLPKSKRYADNEEEWQILLDRQNTIITDLLGSNGKVLLVTGDYHLEGYIELHPLSDVKSIQDISFTSLSFIDLYELSPGEYEKGQIYKPMFSEQVWRPFEFDNLLMDTANYDLIAFFVSIENCCIVAPYDGGIDFIVKDQQTKDTFKEKYKDWLSYREDGL